MTNENESREKKKFWKRKSAKTKGGWRTGVRALLRAN